MANIFKKLFKPKRTSTNFNDAISMVGYEPNFSKFGSSTLCSNLVYAAVQKKCRYFAKLEPRHVRFTDGQLEVITNSAIAKVLKRPNHYQTTYDFLAQAYWKRRQDKTCYILADVYNETETLEGLYVLLPNSKPVLNTKPNGDLEYLFSFDGVEHLVPFDYDTIIVWKDNIEDNQYMGGGKYDAQATSDLLSSLEAYHTIKQSIAEAAKLGCMFDGLLKVNAYAGDEEEVKKIRDKFLEDVRTNAKGIPVLDNGAEYVNIQRQLKMVDSSTMKEIKEDALVSEGVTIEILTGKMTTQDKEAFYEDHIEPAAISLGQAMSKILFTQWQESHGDQIVLYPHKVQLMATSEIVSVISTTISAGVFMVDEYREMLGYAPLPNGEGQVRPRGFNNLDGQNDAGGVTE